MEQTYAPQKQQETASPEKKTLESQGPSMAALRTGAAMPTPGQKGQQVNLPDAMRAKMENAFGADLSAVKLYESKTVADAGAQAVTRGTEIAFAPGMLDFGSSRGQTLLGHEISHVVSQARGEVSRSGGFLNDSALEARADREGAMAAAGQQIAMPTAALSTVTAAPAAGPMQAKKDEELQNPETVVLPEGQMGEMDQLQDSNMWDNAETGTTNKNLGSKIDVIRSRVMEHDQKLGQLEQAMGQQNLMMGQLQQSAQMQDMVTAHMWKETGMNMQPLNPYAAMGASEEDLQGSGAAHPGGMDLNDAVSEDDLKKRKT